MNSAYVPDRQARESSGLRIVPQTRTVHRHGTRRVRVPGLHESGRRAYSIAGGKRSGITGPSPETLAERLRLRSVRETVGHSMSLYVDHTGEPQVDHTGEPLPNWLYARVPREVVCDPGLAVLDIRVYCMLAGSVWQGTTSRIGTRLMARSIHASRRLVIDSLRRLEEREHIQKAAVRRGERELYVLNSLVFGQKQRAGIEEVISSPSRTPRLASVRTA
jgi:hypothetical protein